MTIDLGVVLAAVIPTAAFGLIAFFLKRLLDQIDATLKEIRAEQAAHNQKSDAVHENQWRAISATSAKVAKIEGRMET